MSLEKSYILYNIIFRHTSSDKYYAIIQHFDGWYEGWVLNDAEWFEVTRQPRTIYDYIPVKTNAEE